MITEKEKKLFDTEYFNILLINGFAISVQSKNTKHYWHIEEEEFAHFRHFKLYHKHNRSDEFHRHRDRKNMAAVIDEIKGHDKFQMGDKFDGRCHCG